MNPSSFAEEPIKNSGTPYHSALSINIKPVCEKNVSCQEENCVLEPIKLAETNCFGKAIIFLNNKLLQLSHLVSSRIEKGFYIYGKAIATYPLCIILFCYILTVICGIGLLSFTTEERPFKLWIPQDSDFIKIQHWAKENFPSQYRFHAALYEAENVLDKDVLLDLLDIHDLITTTEVALNSTSTKNSDGVEVIRWYDVCHKLPSISSFSLFRRKRHATEDNFELHGGTGTSMSSEETNNLTKISIEYANDYFHSIYDQPLNDFSFGELSSIMNSHNVPSCASKDYRIKRQAGWTSYLPQEFLCDFTRSIQKECFEKSLLEVWGYDRSLIESLTNEKIVDDVNYVDTSAVFGYPVNFSSYLGGIERNDEGKIIKARATRQVFLTTINFDKIVPGEFIDSFGSGVEIDEGGFRWEEKMVDNLKNASDHLKTKLYFMSSHSFGKISKETIQGDIGFLGLGYTIVFIYVQVMLGKFNWVESRPALSFFGITAVLLSIIISYGLCSALGFMFGPVNNILPFLLLGLGIDDMFVIMQAFNNLSDSEHKLDLSTRIGLALRHSGASILVTSATDIAAFAIGSSTVLPALQSFCMYASVGIATVFFLQSTYFVACLTFDQKRIESNRNAFLCCLKMNNWQPNRCSQKDFCQIFFRDVVAKFLSYPVVKAIVLFITFGFLGVASWGVSNLKQEFDPIWFIPQDTYLAQYFRTDRAYFKSDGSNGMIFFSNISIVKEMPNIEKLVINLQKNMYIDSVDDWYSSYKTYFQDKGYPIPDPEMSEMDFQYDLSEFLFSPAGGRYRDRNFKFSSPLNCSEPAPEVLSFSFMYSYINLKETKDKIAAMNSVKNVVASSNITGFVAPFANIHSSWETDEIIEQELYKNMAFAILVIFIMVLLLIASVMQSIYVLSCVVMTLVDVGALMHWWGLTIDTVSCIDLVLAIGLCVDYAAHVGKLRLFFQIFLYSLFQFL